MKLHQGPVFIDGYGEFNRGHSSLQDEFREGRSKSVVVPKTIDAVLQLILQVGHMTYPEIKATLGISGTNIHSILHEKFVHVGSHTICQSLKKRRLLQKYDRGASKHVYDIATGDESWIYAYGPESNQQSTAWVFQDEPNPTKVVCARSTAKQMIAFFSKKSGHVAIVPLE